MKAIISILMIFTAMQVYSQWGSTMSLDGNPGSMPWVDVTLTEDKVVLSGLNEACSSIPAVFNIPLKNGFSDGFDIEISKDEMGQTNIECYCCEYTVVLNVILKDGGVEYFEIFDCDGQQGATGKYTPMG